MVTCQLKTFQTEGQKHAPTELKLGDTGPVGVSC